jgi:phage-related tail protein
MSDTSSKDAWNRFQADVRSLADGLRRHYKDAEGNQETAEINSALRQIGQATEKFFESLEKATNDPEVRASTKQAARSFGAALGGTLREVGDELDKALKKPNSPPK